MNERKESIPLEQFDEERQGEVYAENAEIARTARGLRASLRTMQGEMDEMRKRLGLYERLDEEPLSPPKWLSPKRSKKGTKSGIPCVVIGDLHWGEVIDPAQVDGVNSYNLEIAEQRLERLCSSTVKVARDYVSGLSFDGLQVFMTGDLISGTIHEELRETNEETAVGSVISITEPLITGLKMLADYFGRVNVAAVVGNHPRSTQRPRAKRRAQDNFDWLIYKLVEKNLSDDDRFSFSIPTAADCYVSVYDTTYLLTHGDQFRGGSGISGAMAPLLLGAHRKTRRAAAAGHPYDYLVCGHWHQSLFWPAKGIIVAGTPKGYDEFAYVSNFESEPPQTSFWISTPEHGPTFHSPIFCSDRDEEGW